MLAGTKEAAGGGNLRETRRTHSILVWSSGGQARLTALGRAWFRCIVRSRRGVHLAEAPWRLRGEVAYFHLLLCWESVGFTKPEHPPELPP